MGAHVLFGLLNELGKFNNTRARISYGIRITLKSHFCSKKVTICHYERSVVMGVIAFPENL